jgi:hypothetical protein
MNVHYLSLDAELRDPQALRQLVVDGVIYIVDCPHPRRHAVKAAPYFDEHGELSCLICHPQTPREETHGDLRDM